MTETIRNLQQAEKYGGPQVSYKTSFCSDLTLFGNDQTFSCSVQTFFPSDQTFFPSDQTFFCDDQTFFSAEQTFLFFDETFFLTEQIFFSAKQSFFLTEQTFFSTETSCSNCIIFVNRSILIVTCLGIDWQTNYYFLPFNLFATWSRWKTKIWKCEYILSDFYYSFCHI